MEDLGREQGINFTRKKVIEQYSGFPEGKRLSYTKDCCKPIKKGAVAHGIRI